MRLKVHMPKDDENKVETRLRGVSFWAGLDSFFAEHGLALRDFLDGLQILGSGSFDIDDRL